MAVTTVTIIFCHVAPPNPGRFVEITSSLGNFRRSQKFNRKAAARARRAKKPTRTKSARPRPRETFALPSTSKGMASSSSSLVALHSLALSQAMPTIGERRTPPRPVGWGETNKQKKQKGKQKRKRSDDEDYVPDEEEEDEDEEDESPDGTRQPSSARRHADSVPCNSHCAMVASTASTASAPLATLAACESVESFMQTLEAAHLVEMCAQWKALRNVNKDDRERFKGRLFMNFDNASVDYSLVLQTILLAQPLPGVLKIVDLAPRCDAIRSFAAELWQVSLGLMKLFARANEHVQSRGGTLHSKWCPLHPSSPREIFPGLTTENHKAVMVSLGGITFKEYLVVCNTLNEEPYTLWGDIEDEDISNAIVQTNITNEFLTVECIRQQNTFQFELHDVFDRYSHIYFNLLSFKDTVGSGLVLNKDGFCKFLSDIFYFQTSAMTFKMLLASPLHWFQAMLHRLLACVTGDDASEVDALKQNLVHSRSEVCAKKKVHAQESCLAYFVEKLKSVVAEELKEKGTDDDEWKNVLKTEKNGKRKIENRDMFGALFGYLRNWPKEVVRKTMGVHQQDPNGPQSEYVDVASRVPFADAFFGCADGNDPCRYDVKRIFMLMSGKNQRFEAYFAPALVAEALRCGYTSIIAHIPGIDPIDASPAPVAATTQPGCSSLALFGNTDLLSVRRDPNVSMDDWLECVCESFGIETHFRESLSGAVSLLGSFPEKQRFLCKWWNGADQCTTDNLLKRLKKQIEVCDTTLEWVEEAKTLTVRSLAIYGKISTYRDQHQCTTSSSLANMGIYRATIQKLSEDLKHEVPSRRLYSFAFLNMWLLYKEEGFTWNLGSNQQCFDPLKSRIELVKKIKELLLSMTTFISTRSTDEQTFGFQMVFDVADAICQRDPIADGSSLFWRFSHLKGSVLEQELAHLSTFFESYTKVPSEFIDSLKVRICDAYKWLVWWSCDESNNRLQLVPKGFIVRERMAVSAALSLLSIAYEHGVLLVTSDQSAYDRAYDDGNDYFMAVLTGDANTRRIGMRQNFDSVISRHWLTFRLFAAISRVVMDATIDNTIDTNPFVSESSLLVYLFDDNDFCYARNERGAFDDWLSSMVSSIGYFYPDTPDFTVFYLTTRQQLATLFNACPHVATKNELFEMQGGHYIRQPKDSKLDRDTSGYNFYHSFYRFDDSACKNDFYSILEPLPEEAEEEFLGDASPGDQADMGGEGDTASTFDEDMVEAEEEIVGDAPFDENMDYIAAFLLMPSPSD